MFVKVEPYGIKILSRRTILFKPETWVAELTEDEFWVLRVYFETHGLGGSHRINDIRLHLLRLSFGRGEQTINSLVQKKALSLSPDKQSVKFTDYGLELYRGSVRTQAEWESQPIIRVSNLDRDQLLIRAGETFLANRVLREIFSQIRQELCIIDPYAGDTLFDLLESIGDRVPIRILTSDRLAKGVVLAYKAFRNQYPHTEMRGLAERTLHDRYILWDGAHGFHLGHSIKDLGSRDTQLSLLTSADEQWRLFKQRWAEAIPIT